LIYSFRDEEKENWLLHFIHQAMLTEKYTLQQIVIALAQPDDTLDEVCSNYFFEI